MQNSRFGVVVTACFCAASFGAGDPSLSLGPVGEAAPVDIRPLVPALVMAHSDRDQSQIVTWNGRDLSILINGRPIAGLVTTLDPMGGLKFATPRRADGKSLVYGRVDLAIGGGIHVELSRPGSKPHRYTVFNAYSVTDDTCDCSDRITLLCTTNHCNNPNTQCPGQADATIICKWFASGKGGGG
jgi:hypothetical protein